MAERVLIGTNEVIDFCKSKKCGYYPAATNSLPHYADFVNRFLTEKAERDLPRAQLDGNVNAANLEHLVEIGGLLKIKEGMMTEIYYAKPEQSMVRVEGDKVVSYGGVPFFPINYFEQGGDIIDWHSHPDGEGNLSDGDVEHMIKTFTPVKMLKEMGYPVGELYFVLYLPHKRNSVWFVPKKIEQ
ncbi:hypothetical protein HYU50_03880 [Candidatus Woesearchaeota archaeon]|nr:hypothetical protein [Candidatus Woesearchaeota archaeon]